MRGDSVDKPLPVGSSVDEIFGLPPILPLEVKWTCTADGNPLIFNAPEGLAGVAENCCMEFTATPDGSSTNIELVMSYDPVSPLADIASPILAIDNAIATVNTARAAYGAAENSLQSASRNLQSYSENLYAAESRIRDVDFAAEFADKTRNDVLGKAGVSLLAQANLNQSTALGLLK